MLTRKHLQALAEATADVTITLGGDVEDAVRAGRTLTKALRAERGITSGFDSGRFDTAVREAYEG